MTSIGTISTAVKIDKYETIRDTFLITKILFVCHGNICRSVMAEMLLKHMVNQAGRADEFYMDSCATSTEEIGNDIYPPAKRCLTAHGIPFTHHSARQITLADYDRFDHIICMERYNLRNLPKITDKVRLLLDRDVADPWYTGDFETTYQDLVEGCKKIMTETAVPSKG